MCQSALEANNHQHGQSHCLHPHLGTRPGEIKTFAMFFLSSQFEVNSEPRIEDEVLFTLFYATNRYKQYLRRFYLLSKALSMYVSVSAKTNHGLCLKDRTKLIKNDF
jgi:hypothetical protein